ncbi:hypothetical protein B0H14DRAFT_2347859 [Mycena olivaceomarginata]|nr:hypothetical protein B0H14DRAFT_2347859 [Mycena olivaceomarginata]
MCTYAVKKVFDGRFEKITTPIHRLALFLHLLCRNSPRKPGNWSRISKATKYHCKSPFAGGQKDTWEWWEVVPRESHGALRDMSIVLASVVPHSADVEHLFSELGGVQTLRCNLMSVDTMEKVGKIRSQLNYELHEHRRAEGKSKHWKHGHMHTAESAGIDVDVAKDLENPITWIPPLEGDDEEHGDVVEKASRDLRRVLEDEAPMTDAGSVISWELVDFDELERIEKGESTGIEEDIIDTAGRGPGGSWSTADPMN